MKTQRNHNLLSEYVFSQFKGAYLSFPFFNITDR